MMFLTQLISSTYLYLLIGLFSLFIILVFIFLFYGISYRRSLKRAEKRNCVAEIKNSKNKNSIEEKNKKRGRS